MESGWRKYLASIGNNGDSNDMKVHNNSNLTNNAWDNNPNTIISTTISTTTTTSSTPFAYGGTPYYDYTNQILFNNNNNHCMRDPHMMCLRLGKRHYCSCKDSTVVVPGRYVAAESSSAANKRPEKQPYPYAMTARCQVDGCHVALSNVKEYYKRHKVCENHSKAPKVVVLGLQQRFCQQCSRFHVMSEFDETKRSCRRRLEGHNQRRRKGTIANTLPRNFPHFHENQHPMMGQQLRPLSRLPSPPPPPHDSKPGYALSLLSSPNMEPWMISSGDLSSRCSAALYELIAANRATNVLGSNFLNQNSSHQAVIENTMETLPNTQMWIDSTIHITRP